MDETSIRLQGNFGRTVYGVALRMSLERALALHHKLPEPILAMQGMSGRKYRSLINTLVELVPEPRYLEVGSWAGSTACSAMWGNKATITCIDNWSQFSGPKDIFLNNTSVTLNPNIKFAHIESDFRQIDWRSLPATNIYLFDGPHSEADQYDGIVIAQPALDGTHVLIVDDYNWPSVRNGTLRAINDLNLDVECSIEIRTTQDNSHAKITQADSEWHNGYFLAVVRKREAHPAA